ncbi:MAG: type 2 isopentenyl-diphosphate Delta-isomerase [Bacillus sp. (in: Bacteria)]|nr:type 2 isopentenyl-diphosphate Delta-isomerase [Bacillus sp. (in: firmicutes)]
MSRAQRKQEHIRYALEIGQSRKNGFDDVIFVHQSLPECAIDQIELHTQIGELSISSPIFINAMTGGGGKQTEQINEQLAIAARETNIPMAVGSQMSALKDPTERTSYEIVRKVNPTGIIFANLGSEASVDQARMAVEMIEANALQIHLNVVQELTMPEGDKDFRGMVDRIQNIIEKVDVPVIVKETGFGMSREAAQTLTEIGVAAIDVGGYGGTNFAAIENARRKRMLNYFNDWGIPTVASIVETKEGAKDLDIIASGGIQTSLDVVKSISLGASLCGLAGFVLKKLQEHSIEGVIEEIQHIHEDIRFIMCALGAPHLSALRHIPLLITGKMREWLELRGLHPERFSMRSLKK